MLSPLRNGRRTNDSVSGFPPMPHGENRHHGAVKAIDGDIAAAAERDEPFAELGRHLWYRSADLGMFRQRLHRVANRANGTARGIPALRHEKTVQSFDVLQRRRRPDDPRHELVVWYGRLGILAGLEPGKPAIGFFPRQVAACRLIRGPGGERLLA